MGDDHLRILIVEDEGAHVEAISRALIRAHPSCEILSVTSLRGYFQCIAKDVPDVVLMDLNLSDGSALDILPGGAVDRPFPILIMTAHGNEAMAVAAMKAGALDYVVKSPESFAAMPQIVQRVLREWRLLQDKKQAELALRQSEQRLRLAVREAEAASHAKSEFLANMSHEIRTPLNGIFGMLQCLQTTPLAEDQAECIDLALESGRKLLNILNDILDLSRIEAGRLDLQMACFDPARLVHQIRDIFHANAAAKNLVLHCDISPDFPEQVFGDEGRLRQVLFNLVGNAVKFTEQGQITLGAEASLDPERPGGVRLGFTVHDTGIGIPRDKLDIVFEPFVQVDGSSTRRFGGAGLGLGIVKRLVQLMNGHLSIDSELGVGTRIRFSIEVDQVPSDDALLGAVAAVEPSMTRSLKILLAEDERINRLTLERLLTKQGHEVQAVADGRQCIELLRKDRFDLVLMDIQMPDMDGLEVTRRARSDDDPRISRIPIVALTAHAMKGDREKFLEAGMDDYICKPVHMDEIRRILARFA
ncbi:response regulator [Geoalkalibacter sp.]|uniref:response regulator n=1 Tax=Geoalkalibacter sp. TaxID=3041440 RepID=UPI00272DE716|nr:response regulator [Geoalkalibacter sp.]